MSDHVIPRHTCKVRTDVLWQCRKCRRWYDHGKPVRWYMWKVKRRIREHMFLRAVHQRLLDEGGVQQR